MSKRLSFIINNLSVLALLFCFSLVNAQPPKGQVVEKIVAKVDNEIILKSELDIAYLQFDGGSIAPELLKCKVLETLVINKMLVAKAVTDSVVVDKAQVDDQLNRRMQMVLQQFGGDEEALLKNYGKSSSQIKSEMRDQVREQLIVQRMQGKISEGVSVTPSEVKDFFNAIDKDSLPFFSTEVEVGHIVKLPIVNENARQESIDLLKDLKKRIEEGESFGALAKQFSEDPGSGANGGELGFFKRGELVPPYEAASLRMKPGEMSGIVESQFGFHLIQLIERRGNEYNTKHILVKPKSSQNDLEGARLFLDTLRNQIISDSINFTKAAYDNSDDPMTKPNGGFFADQTSNTRIPADQIDPSLYFLVDKMQPGDVSEPHAYTMADGKPAMRIVFLKNRIKPHEANLKDDYQKIYEATIAQKKEEKVSEWFEATKGEVFIYIDDEHKGCEILATP